MKNKFFILSFAALFILPLLFYPAVSKSGWISSSDVHAFFEFASSLLAITAGIMVLLHFFTTGRWFFLIISIGFVLISAEEFVHAIFSFNRIWPEISPTFKLAISSTWLTGRFILSISFITALIFGEREIVQAKRGRSAVVYNIIGLICAAFVTLLIFSSPFLPNFVQLGSITKKLIELFLALLFFAAFLIYSNIYLKQESRSPLLWSIIACIIFQVLAHIFVFDSRAFYDSHWDTAHLIVFLSYFFPIFGVWGETIKLHKSAQVQAIELEKEMTERKKAEEALVADMKGLNKLLQIGSLFIREGRFQEVLDEMVKTAIDISNADMGNIQLLDTQSGNLEIVAQHGFEQHWVDFWNSVGKGKGTCGAALERGKRVIVEDITQSSIFVGTPAMDVQLAAGVRAVQSTPLMSREGKLMGMFSTHFCRPHRPDERTLHLLDLLARQTADIIERKKAEEAILSAAREWSASFDAMSDGVSIHSADYTIINVNQPLCQILGKTAEEMIGEKCYQIFHGKNCPIADCPFQRLKETKQRASVEIFEPMLNKWLTVSTSPIFDASGSMVRIVHTISDITERRNLESQLRHAQKMEAIGTLAGGIAHDFNNILTAIMGYASVIQMKMPGDDPLREHLEQILTSSERAGVLTQSLLAFSRKQISMPESADLNEIVKKAGKILSRVIGEDIELKIISADMGLTVMADAGQIEQVLMNLATNARDAMPKGGALTIQTEPVEFNSEFINAFGYGDVGKYACIIVSDTGVGIDASIKENIFEPFFTTKEVGKGTGLGLSMVYGIVKQHKGYINCYSEPDRGTTFKIYIPMFESMPVSKTAAERAAVSVPTGGTETILVAEDEESVRNLVKAVLEEYGYKVIEAADGEEAVNKFMKNKDRINLLLLDIIMPKMNGKEAYERIKKIKPGIKILFASGYPSDLITEKGIIEEGFNFVAKPMSPTNLLKKVRETLDK